MEPEPQINTPMSPLRPVCCLNIRNAHPMFPLKATKVSYLEAPIQIDFARSYTGSVSSLLLSKYPEMMLRLWPSKGHDFHQVVHLAQTAQA